MELPVCDLCLCQDGWSRRIGGNTHYMHGLQWNTCGMHKNAMTNANKEAIQKMLDLAKKNYLESVR